jgi:hypothetical protein
MFTPDWVLSQGDTHNSILDIPSMSTYVYTITQKFVTKCDNSMYPHIAEIVNYSISTLHYKRYKYKRLKHILV